MIDRTCPDHTTVEMVPSPINGLDFCPMVDCHWWYGWPVKRTQAFVVEAEILRSEELRPDRLGPSPDDVPLTIPELEIRPSKNF